MSILSTLAQATLYDTPEPTLYTTTPGDVAAFAAFMSAVMTFAFILSIVMYVLYAVCLMSIFKKAGVQSWIAWVPFYNTWKLLEIGGQQGFWAVLAIIPVVNIVSAVFMYISMYNVGLKLQKSGAFVLLAIFLTPVWLIWLAADSSKWDDTKGAPSLA